MLTRGRALGLGLVVAAMVLLASRLSGLSAPASWTAAITTLCACWWVLEPIPIPATSIIPFALFPLVGVLDDKQVATAYGVVTEQRKFPFRWTFYIDREGTIRFIDKQVKPATAGTDVAARLAQLNLE